MHDYTLQYKLVLHSIVTDCMVLYNIVLYSVLYSKGLNCRCCSLRRTCDLYHSIDLARRNSIDLQYRAPSLLLRAEMAYWGLATIVASVCYLG